MKFADCANLMLIIFTGYCGLVKGNLIRDQRNTVEKIYCPEEFPVETLSIPIPNSPFVIKMFHNGTRIYITRLDNQNIVILLEYKMPYMYSKLNNDSLEMTLENGDYIIKYLHDNSISGPSIATFKAQGKVFDNISFSEDVKLDIKNRLTDKHNIAPLCSEVNKYNYTLANTIKSDVRIPEGSYWNSIVVPPYAIIIIIILIIIVIIFIVAVCWLVVRNSKLRKKLNSRECNEDIISLINRQSPKIFLEFGTQTDVETNNRPEPEEVNSNPSNAQVSPFVEEDKKKTDEKTNDQPLTEEVEYRTSEPEEDRYQTARPESRPKTL